MELRFEGGFGWYYTQGQVVYYGCYSVPSYVSPSWCVWLLPGFHDE